MHPHHISPSNPCAHGGPDPCGLAPAACTELALAGSAAPPEVLAPIRRGRRSAVRVRAGVVRQGRAMRHLASEVGQGTVEYVGLLLLMATLLAGIVTAADKLGGKDQIGTKLVNQIGNNIDKAGSGK